MPTAKRQIQVHALPTLVPPDALVGGTAVVIDVLRATTTILHALHAGAREVVPLVDVDAARKAAETIEPEKRLLGGERGGMPIEGFDLGNSPQDYTPERVAEKTILFTTTNGTRAIEVASAAAEVVPAGFVNAAAVVDHLETRERIDIICAGTNGKYTEEDLLLAGLLVERITREDPLAFRFNTQAITVCEQWRRTLPLPKILGHEPIPPETLNGILRKSTGGKNLVKIGLARDILVASQVDRLNVLATFDAPSGTIRAIHSPHSTSNPS
jgi:2-phosphosulfolactate phosphatase